MPHEKHQANERAWSQAAASYRMNVGKTAAFLRGGGVSMCPPELPYLKDLATWCRRAVHLQCAGGEDTLSLLNLGAGEVVGIDISPAMIDVAREVTAQLGARATWIVSDVFDVPTSLDATADLVYTGRGAVNWIHDLGPWARTIARLLKPGGALYMFEGHPITYAFDQTATTLQPDGEFEGYFSRKVYVTAGWTPEYVGELGLKDGELAPKHELAWPVSEVINALLAAGLRLERFEEHPDAYWAEFPNMPEAERQRIPNTYSLLMRR